jgi:hypothetical protein
MNKEEFKWFDRIGAVVLFLTLIGLYLVLK